MTLLFDSRAFQTYVNEEMVRQAMIEVCEAEASEQAALPTRLDVPTPRGFLRVMPAWLHDVMGLKVMTLVEGLGTRYLVLLYAVETGELLALFDADELTRVRTAATTALAAQVMVSQPPASLGLLGSGFEARGQLEALARLWPLQTVTLFSPTPAHREEFAQQMSQRLGLTVTAATSPEEAIKDQPVVLLATKAKRPVVNGEHLARGCVVLSIGSTRPDLRELDAATLARAGTVVGDAPDQLASESGDIIAALETGGLTRAQIVSLSAARATPQILRTEPGRDLLVFKSVGTALQDLALARALYNAASADGDGGSVTRIAEIPRLKPFEKAGPGKRSSET